MTKLRALALALPVGVVACGAGPARPPPTGAPQGDTSAAAEPPQAPAVVATAAPEGADETTRREAASAAAEPCDARKPRTVGALDGLGLETMIVSPSPCAPGPRPMLLYFHSACDSPKTECPAFSGEATADLLVACPRGQSRCGNGGAAWAFGPPLWREAGPALVERVTNAPGLSVERGHAIVVGLSQGATVAVEVAQRSRDRFDALVILGATVMPDVDKLNEAGIKAVLFASGRHDPARAGMQAAAKKVAARGLRAKYESLGDVGHALGPDMNAFLRDALAWLHEP